MNPVLTSKGKFSKAVARKFVQGTVIGDREGFSRTRRPGKGHLDTVVDGKTLREIIPILPFTLKLNRNLRTEDWKDMDKVLQFHQLLKNLFQWSMDNNRFNVASYWAELGAIFQKICLKEIENNNLIVITKCWNPTRQFRLLEVSLTRSIPNQLSSNFTPFRNHQISGQESPFFTIPGSFQEKTRIQGQKQHLFQPKTAGVRLNYPEALGLGERSTQEAEIIVHTSKISNPINRNITPTQIEHDVFTPKGNLNSDALLLKMSQFTEKNQKKFAELQASHERMKALTASMDKIVKTLQEGYSHLIKASEETNKRLNQVFEEQLQGKGTGIFWTNT
ncbi:hypothetical protein O181_009134 [Austropuccinia psidii MF-1]|uniref:Uncharacterized protein n=1 Tax=Austropuccinia psidii MF-1 TaxID=1389203 RepID=A0A9Q3GJJ3_9BASI|nr:hypothetical protein [Austropuccinia psidii MF-1]